MTDNNQNKDKYIRNEKRELSGCREECSISSLARTKGGGDRLATTPCALLRNFFFQVTTT